VQSWWSGFRMKSIECVQPYGNLSITAAFNISGTSNVVFFLATFIYNNATVSNKTLQHQTTWWVGL